MKRNTRNRVNKKHSQALFQPGDLVWKHLRKERFPRKRKNLLIPRAESPLIVLQWFGEIVHKIELPDDFGGVRATFNIRDLSPYQVDKNLRENSFGEGGE